MQKNVLKDVDFSLFKNSLYTKLSNSIVEYGDALSFMLKESNSIRNGHDPFL